jgi:hypothetical protein
LGTYKITTSAEYNDKPVGAAERKTIGNTVTKK